MSIKFSLLKISNGIRSRVNWSGNCRG